MEKSELLNSMVQDPILHEKYVLKSLISTKDNIFIYQAYHRHLKKLVTLKVQTISLLQLSNSILEKEYNLFKILKEYPGIPQINEKGKWQNGIYIQMQCLKKNLAYMTLKTTKFKQKQLSYVLSKIIRIIAAFHDIGFVLNEIFPQMFSIALDKKIYIMSCAKAQPMEDSFLKVTSHKQVKSTRSLNYASIRSLKGKKQTYADDIQSAYYMLSHFYHKSLPWVHQKKVSSNQGIIQRHSSANNYIAAMGKNYILGFRYIKNLYYKVKPNYEYLLRLYQLQKYQKNPISKSRISISQNFNNEFEEEIKSIISTKTINSCVSISHRISSENRRQIIPIKQNLLTSNSISAIIINKVSKNSISTQETSNKNLLSLLNLIDYGKSNQIDDINEPTFDDKAEFENFQEIQNQLQADLDIQPPKIPQIHSIVINHNLQF